MAGPPVVAIDLVAGHYLVVRSLAVVATVAEEAVVADLVGSVMAAGLVVEATASCAVAESSRVAEEIAPGPSTLRS